MGRLAALLAVAAPLAAADGMARAAEVVELIAGCPACHGENGQSVRPEVPSLGGQPELFALYQLVFFRLGRRKTPEMNAVIADASDDDLRALAAHVAALPPPAPPEEPADAERYRRGAAIAARRRCAVCHGPELGGREQMPRLAHQQEAYLLKALEDYQSGARIGTQAAMAETLAGLDAAALADLAHYLAHFR